MEPITKDILKEIIKAANATFPVVPATLRHIEKWEPTTHLKLLAGYDERKYKCPVSADDKVYEATVHTFNGSPAGAKITRRQREMRDDT